MSTLSSSRNSGQTDLLLGFTEGLAFDRQLYAEEIAVQTAWIKELERLKVLSSAEAVQARALLNEAHDAIAQDRFEWRQEDEDIHMNLERFLTERAGELGKKVHLGRSRNDLIATTLRLKVAALCRDFSDDLLALVTAIQSFSRARQDDLVPGLTHMQNGQPIRFAQAFSAHAWAFTRDLKRFAQAQTRSLESMPLGSGALSGTPLAIDEAALCKELGFAGPSFNAYDSVSDRDYMIETLNAIESTALHLNRLAEDVIFYSSGAVGLIRLPKAWSTGSSMMPNKRNPDVMELMRGRANRIMGLCHGASHLLKSVCLSYGSDLHELKKTFLLASAELNECLKIAPCFIAEMGFSASRAKELLGAGHILATEVADHLTSSGMTFRDAYRLVATLVELADAREVQVHELDLATLDLETSSLRRLESFWSDLSFEKAVERRKGLAGASKASVLRALARLEAEATRLAADLRAASPAEKQK